MEIALEKATTKIVMSMGKSNSDNFICDEANSIPIKINTSELITKARWETDFSIYSSDFGVSIWRE